MNRIGAVWQSAGGRAIRYADKSAGNRSAPITGGNCALERALRWGRASRELEVTDTSAPVEGAVGVVILIDRPEGAVVGRIDDERLVVAPAVAAARLHRGASEQGLLSGKSARDIEVTPGITDRWEHRGARDTVAYGQVTLVIQRRARQPTV